MFVTTPPGDEWHWIRDIHNSYHKWTQQSLASWLTKATKDNSKPPKAKHVRRILIASLRDPCVTPLFVAQYFLDERPWRDDARISAKCLYIMLVLLQYREELASQFEVSRFTDKVVAYWDGKFPEEKQQISTAISLRMGSIIHSKLIFHQTHPEVEGNFAIKGERNFDKIIPDLRKHLKTVEYETMGVEAAVSSSESFTATVLWQPMVDETVSAYRLLKSIDKSSESNIILGDCEKLIQKLPDYPFIATTVIFPLPGENVTIPRERFPKNI